MKFYSLTKSHSKFWPTKRPTTDFTYLKQRLRFTCMCIVFHSGVIQCQTIVDVDLFYFYFASSLSVYWSTLSVLSRAPENTLFYLALNYKVSFTWYNLLSNRLSIRLTTGWMFVHTVQPVVKPVVKPVWQPVVSCIQTFNRLSNPYDNRFDNRLYRVYSRLSNRLYNPVWQPVERTATVCSTGCQTGLTTGWMFVYTIQPVVSCKRGITFTHPFNLVL